MRLASPHDPTPRIVVAFFALVAVVFVGVYPFFTTVNNPNENVRTYETMAIVELHTFRIDEIIQRYGWVNDMAAVPEPDGTRHLFSVKAPAVSYAGVPVYWAFRILAPHLGLKEATNDSTQQQKDDWLTAATCVLRLFTIQLPCFAFLVWLERWLRGTSPDKILRLACVAAAGLGSNYLAYSLMFASHAPFAIAAFASFAITTGERARHPFDPKKRRLSAAFWAGFFAGLTTLLEYHALPVSVCLAAYALVAFWRPLRLAMFGLGGAINAAALMYFQWRCFKSPFTPGHKMSENQAYKHLLSQGYFGIGKPDWKVFGSISFDRGYGFFGTSPFMWLGLLAIPFAIVLGYGSLRERAQRRDATIAWMLTMLALWTTVSAAINWRGGWTVGPRYLGAAPPFFAYGALCAFEAIAADSHVRRAVVRGIAGGAAFASVLSIGIVGMHFNTIPEEITRPLVQVTLPMAMAGFVPHHALEWFGVTSGWFWYFAAACALAAAGVAVFAPWQEQKWTWPLRTAVGVAVFMLGMTPALSSPDVTEQRDLGAHARRSFVGMWRPVGRDRIEALREEAESYGSRRPCTWLRLAATERLVTMSAEAMHDEARANPRPVCHNLDLRMDDAIQRRLIPGPR